MINQNPLEFRSSLTDAEFKLHLYKLTIKELNEYLELFNNLGMYDCVIILDILNEKINSIVTSIDQ